MSASDEHDELRLTAEEFADGAAAELGDIEIVDGRVIRLIPSIRWNSPEWRTRTGAAERGVGKRIHG